MFKWFYRALQKLWYSYLIDRDKKWGVDFYAVVDNKGTPEALAGHRRYIATSHMYDRTLKGFLRKQDHAETAKK